MYAYGPIWSGFHFWWIIPIIMIVLCFLMMRHGVGCMMGRRSSGESAREILDRRYASGEIGKEEYEEKKRRIAE